MGGIQAVQPLFVEETVRPALMVLPLPSTAPPASLAQDAAQATANPAVQVRKQGRVTVSKVGKPAAKLHVQPRTHVPADFARSCVWSSPALLP